MKFNLPVVLLSLLVAAPVAAQQAAAATVVATKGKTLVDARGGRLGTVNRVTEDGSAKIIIDGRMVTVPAATLSLVNGKLTTSLKKAEVLALR